LDELGLKVRKRKESHIGPDTTGYGRLIGDFLQGTRNIKGRRISQWKQEKYKTSGRPGEQVTRQDKRTREDGTVRPEIQSAKKYEGLSYCTVRRGAGGDTALDKTGEMDIFGQ